MLGLAAVVHRELAAQWLSPFVEDKHKVITDIGADEEDLIALEKDQEGAMTIVERWATDWKPRGEHRSNLEDALEVVRQIEALRAVQRELKSAFAKSELDGGAKAAPNHPLYIQAQEALDKLHDQLTMII